MVSRPFADELERQVVDYRTREGQWPSDAYVGREFFAGLTEDAMSSSRYSDSAPMEHTLRVHVEYDRALSVHLTNAPPEEGSRARVR